MNNVWCNRCYSGNVKWITYSECVFVGIKNVTLKRHIVICVLSRSTIFCPHYLIKGKIFGKQSLDTKCVFWFSLQLLSETFLILRRTERDIYCISTVNRQNFPTLSHKLHYFRKKSLNTKCVFWFSLQLLFETFLILRKTERDIIKNVYRSWCEVSVVTVRFEETANFF